MLNGDQALICQYRLAFSDTGERQDFAEKPAGRPDLVRGRDVDVLAAAEDIEGILLAGEPGQHPRLDLREVRDRQPLQGTGHDGRAQAGRDYP
jgi:hypothetical protein